MRKLNLILLATSFLFTYLNASPATAEELMVQSTRAAFEMTNLEYAHSRGFDGEGQVIVVLDDGVEVEHPMFVGANVDGFCASRESCGEKLGLRGIQYGATAPDNFSHGTMVASVALGRPTIRALGGVAPKAKLISINVEAGNNDAIIRALEWVYSVRNEHKIAAVNLSAGGGLPFLRGKPHPCEFIGGGDKEIFDLIQKLSEVNIPFVVAAGNGSKSATVDFPACIERAITVGAVSAFVSTSSPWGYMSDPDYSQKKGDVLWYSNIGPQVDVLAPSDAVLAARVGKDYELGTGTSAAAPFIAGAIAILKQAKPGATFEEIRKALGSTKTYVNDVQYQDLPVIDFSTAITAIQSGVFSDKPVKPIEIQSLQIEKAKAEAEAKLAKDAQGKAEAEAKLAKDAQTKAEADAKLAKDAQTKAEADAKLAKDAQTKAEADFKSSQAILSQIQAETSKLKADFEVIRVQTSELVSMSTLLQKQNDTLKKKLSVICKAKPKPKGC